MKCPKCDAEMKSVKIGEITVDKCPECSGVWFDFDELEQALEKHEVDALRDGIDTHSHNDSKEAACPRCGGKGKMIQVVHPEHDIRVDTCKVCYGQWLDGGEFSKLKKETLFGSFFQNLF